VALNIPNDILNDTDADAAPLQQNFDVVESYVNTEVVTRDGSVAMVAPLLLPGPPSSGQQAATKNYVDNTDAARKAYVDTQDAKRVAVVGDTMTGKLTMAAQIDMQHNAIVNLPSPSGDEEAARKVYVDNQVGACLQKSGGTMTGQLNMGNWSIFNLRTPTGADPGQYAATKEYVDNGRAGKADINMNNHSIYNLNPTTASDGDNYAATKGYVDNKVSALEAKLAALEARLGQ
jgi:hypothetical protein